MKKWADKDIEYMETALCLASKAKDKTYPNPMVGAVIVKSGKIIGRGYHRKAGEGHAEVRAINSSRVSCRGATMYVTLEPCDHHGKTPPCTEAIIESGIKRVVAAMKDPNPLNSGRGMRRLRRAGVKVEAGLLESMAKELNRKYSKFITTGLPYVTVKLAQSVDGKIAARDGSSKWISSDESRRYVRKIRHDFDAVLVGANTVLKDDPFLLDEKRRGYGTARVVADTKLRTPPDSNLIRTASRSPVLIGTTELAPEAKIRKMRRIEGVDVIRTRSSAGKVPLRPFLRALARKGIVNLMVEGGGELAGALLDASLADEIMFFISPKILGGPYVSVKGRGVKNISRALKVRNMKVSMSGDDILIRGLVCSPV